MSLLSICFYIRVKELRFRILEEMHIVCYSLSFWFYLEPQKVIISLGY